jgi:enolase
MIMPVSMTNFPDALRAGVEVFHALKSHLKQSGHSTNVGDEGGFAPALRSTREALDFISQAIQDAGYTAGRDIVFALDAAATEFFQHGAYHLHGEDKVLSTPQMVDYYQKLCAAYPIASIEDGLAEDDWQGWELLTSALGDSVQLVGDDLYVTNPERLSRGIAQKAGNAVLVKVNQIGTLTETLAAISMAKAADFGIVLSHRSGETEDTVIADLAVATQAGQIKTGAPSRSDRTAKYNQILRIAEELGSQAKYAGGSIL